MHSNCDKHKHKSTLDLWQLEIIVWPWDDLGSIMPHAHVGGGSYLYKICSTSRCFCGCDNHVEAEFFHFYIVSFSNFDDPSFDDSQMLSQFLIKLCFYGGVQILLNFKIALLLRL